jgi:hypothetical protein
MRPRLLSYVWLTGREFLFGVAYWATGFAGAMTTIDQADQATFLRKVPLGL